jgi:microcystin-dependent protein
MATVTGLTAERMIEMENATVIDGDIISDHLILVTRGGTPIDAGNVRGAVGPTGGAAFVPCLSTARPGYTSEEKGKSIYETDTGLRRMWTGTRWQLQERIICTSGTRPAGMTLADEGVQIFEKDTNYEFVWSGTSWISLPDAITPVGSEMIWPGTLASIPTKYMLEDGRKLYRADYPQLFEVLQTTWNTGGETGSEFRIPNALNKVVVGAGGLLTVGAYGGNNVHTLTTAELPSHVHQAAGSGVLVAGMIGATLGWTDTPGSLIPVGVAAPFNTGPAGGGGSHNNMQAFAAKHVVIRAT